MVQTRIHRRMEMPNRRSPSPMIARSGPGIIAEDVVGRPLPLRRMCRLCIPAKSTRRARVQMPILPRCAVDIAKVLPTLRHLIRGLARGRNIGLRGLPMGRTRDRRTGGRSVPCAKNEWSGGRSGQFLFRLKYRNRFSPNGPPSVAWRAGPITSVAFQVLREFTRTRQRSPLPTNPLIPLNSFPAPPPFLRLDFRGITNGRALEMELWKYYSPEDVTEARPGEFRTR